MENLSGISGYVASMLVLLTFVAKDMRLLRATAIFSNVAFITYGAIVWLPPVLLLHLVLLPLNIVRLSEAISTDRITDNPIPTVPTTAHLCIRLRYPLLEQRSLARHNRPGSADAPLEMISSC